jgi:hypothetical protein
MARVFKKDKDKGSSSKDAGKGHARERGAKPRRDSVKDRSQGWFAARLQSTPARIMAPRMLYALSVIVLCMLGLVMIYSASSITAYEKFHNASYYFDRQVIFLIFGAIFCVILSVVPYRVLGKPVVFVTLWVIAVGLLCLTAFGGGVSALGAERSIMVGSFAVQPAEFAKIAVVLAMCSLVAMQRENPMPFMRFVVIVLVASLVPLFLIYRQPDLGTAIILAVGLIAMAILAGVPWKAIFIFIGSSPSTWSLPASRSPTTSSASSRCSIPGSTPTETATSPFSRSTPLETAGCRHGARPVQAEVPLPALCAHRLHLCHHRRGTRLCGRSLRRLALRHLHLLRYAHCPLRARHVRVPARRLAHRHGGLSGLREHGLRLRHCASHGKGASLRELRRLVHCGLAHHGRHHALRLHALEPRRPLRAPPRRLSRHRGQEVQEEHQPWR